MSGMGNVYAFAELCRRAGKNLTRENFIKTVESTNDENFNNPFMRGAKFGFSSTRHRACSSIMIGQIKGGQLERVTGWLHWKTCQFLKYTNCKSQAPTNRTRGLNNDEAFHPYPA